MPKRTIQLSWLFLIVWAVAGCANTPKRPPHFETWDEEVKLNDGRVIVVSQKYLCDPDATWICIDREAWLTINLPEFSSEPIIWHEKLRPRILNIHNGDLYVVGYPSTRLEFEFYGKPEPAYVGFRYVEKQWQKIPFKEIPEAIYDTNMIVAPTDIRSRYVDLQSKKTATEWRIKPEQRIDPNYRYRQAIPPK